MMLALSKSVIRLTSAARTYFGKIGTRTELRLCAVSNVHTTSCRRDLMEFFDNEKNWGIEQIRVGRSWRKEELRLKSNSDLHKLWFVLLKERNMLLTMEHEYNDKVKPFPNPERVDKVKESMHNLEEVVKERNRAYYELETGESGERPGKLVFNQLGMRFFYKMREHLIPKELNSKWREKHVHYYNVKEVEKFLRFYGEKIRRMNVWERRRERRHVFELLRRFPNMDREALKEKYPHIDLDRLLRERELRANRLLD